MQSTYNGGARARGIGESQHKTFGDRGSVGDLGSPMGAQGALLGSQVAQLGGQKSWTVYKVFMIKRPGGCPWGPAGSPWDPQWIPDDPQRVPETQARFFCVKHISVQFAAWS